MQLLPAIQLLLNMLVDVVRVVEEEEEVVVVVVEVEF